MRIPVVDIARQDRSIRPELEAAIGRVIDRSRFILGAEVEAFEQAFAAYCGVAHALGVGSGTDALQVALLACGIGPGDEVITVSHTSPATIAAIELTGAGAVPIDIDPRRFTMDPGRIAAACTPRTRALLPVHLYGQPADLGPILEFAARRGLPVIEDCSQAHGARYREKSVGAWGRIAAFSFYPTKNLGAYGDGGAVVTDDPQLAERARQIRQYGWDAGRVSRRKGINSRLDEIQAAILGVKLRRLEGWNAERRRLASMYDSRLTAKTLTTPYAAPDSIHVYHAYVIRHPRRDALRAHLAQRGISSAIHFSPPVHLHPGFSNLAGFSAGLPESEAAAREVLTLPLFPGMREDELQQVVDAVTAF
ncbi:MAG: DegT/DnrJ/EryC1/StrS family aminotransferase [Anaerolineales bacterium]|nr:DegT/DnrJ/EryC1/StrS family aminotransferase [Anaerolineales bacterium]